MQRSSPPSRSMTTSTPRAAATFHRWMAADMNSRPSSSIWKISIPQSRRSVSSGGSQAEWALGHLGAEIGDGFDQALFERHLRLPLQQRAGKGDVGTPLLGVVG